MGIGVPNVHEAWTWYRKHFGMDIPVFEEAATADRSARSLLLNNVIKDVISSAAFYPKCVSEIRILL